MPALDRGGRAEGGPHEFKRTVYRYMLQLLADQSRRVPFPVVGLTIVLALIASQRMPAWIPAIWLLFAMGVLALRWRWLGLLPRRDELSLKTRLRLAVGLSLLNGLAHGASLAAFPVLTEPERAFFTVLLLGLCTGGVGTTAGYRPVYIAYTLPVLVPLTLLWAWSPRSTDPSWVERSIALLIGLYFWILLGLARDAWKRFLESVRIRYQERALNLKLQGALLHANEANLAKTRFLAAASHDLRQPLHTIGLLVAALSLRPANQRDKEIIDLLGQVTVALSAQLDGLLDVSKLDAGVVFAENKVFDLDDLLRQHHAELDPAARAQGLQAHLRSTANVFVETDPNLFLRVLRNLTDNALKFTEKGAVALELTVSKGRACVVVRDSGMGIPRELQAQVFEEFYQVHNPERDRSKGLGLGLSIVRRLVDLLGLEITMDSRPGAGTAFELRLPLARRPEPAVIKGHPPEDHYLGLHVLVLDDERSVRYSIRLLLEEMSCTCMDAGSTQEALELARQRVPDLILADLRLRGDENGIAAIRALRSLCGDVPALLISGDTAPDRLQDAQRAGIRLLHKPVGLNTLRAEMQAALMEKTRAETQQ
jgi:signal transduction histidine kinase/ActR/RegA family two-component response regulator